MGISEKRMQKHLKLRGRVTDSLRWTGDPGDDQSNPLTEIKKLTALTLEL